MSKARERRRKLLFKKGGGRALVRKGEYEKVVALLGRKEKTGGGEKSSP